MAFPHKLKKIYHSCEPGQPLVILCGDLNTTLDSSTCQVWVLAPGCAFVDYAKQLVLLAAWLLNGCSYCSQRAKHVLQQS